MLRIFTGPNGYATSVSLALVAAIIIIGIVTLWASGGFEKKSKSVEDVAVTTTVDDPDTVVTSVTTSGVMSNPYVGTERFRQAAITDRNAVISHHGSEGISPSFHLPSLVELCANHGLEFVSFDVRKTSDDHWVCCSADTIGAITNSTNTIASSTLADIQAHSVVNGNQAMWTGDRFMPSLAQVYAAIKEYDVTLFPLIATDDASGLVTYIEANEIPMNRLVLQGKTSAHLTTFKTSGYTTMFISESTADSDTVRSLGVADYVANDSASTAITSHHQTSEYPNGVFNLNRYHSIVSVNDHESYEWNRLNRQYFGFTISDHPIHLMNQLSASQTFDPFNIQHLRANAGNLMVSDSDGSSETRSPYHADMIDDVLHVDVDASNIPHSKSYYSLNMGSYRLNPNGVSNVGMVMAGKLNMRANTANNSTLFVAVRLGHDEPMSEAMTTGNLTVMLGFTKISNSVIDINISTRTGSVDTDRGYLQVNHSVDTDLYWSIVQTNANNWYLKLGNSAFTVDEIDSGDVISWPATNGYKYTETTTWPRYMSIYAESGLSAPVQAELEYHGVFHL